MSGFEYNNIRPDGVEDVELLDEPEVSADD